MPESSNYASIWRQHEKQFSDVLYTSAKDRPIERIINSRVLLTAPHAVTHFRAGKSKGADRGTGGLAQTLGELLNLDYMIETSGVGDPSWDDDHDFKKSILQKRPYLIVDLHGMKLSQESDVDLGLGLHSTVKEREAVELFLDAYRGLSINVTVGRIFNAGRENTITSWAQRNRMTAFQIEMGANVRPPTGNDAMLNNFVKGFAVFIERISTMAKTV